MEIWQGVDVKIYVLLRISQVVLRALGISQTSLGSFAPSSAPGGGEFRCWNAGTPRNLRACVCLSSHFLRGALPAATADCFVAVAAPLSPPSPLQLFELVKHLRGNEEAFD